MLSQLNALINIIKLLVFEQGSDMVR